MFFMRKWLTEVAAAMNHDHAGVAGMDMDIQ
jgi:hypothetical protein